MKTINYIIVISLLSLVNTVMAQEYKIPVENSKTGKLSLEGFVGNLPIEGYNGNEIIITVNNLSTEEPERAKGLKPLNQNGKELGLNIEKNGNLVNIRRQSKTGDYRFKVPENFSLEIKGNDMEINNFSYNFGPGKNNGGVSSSYISTGNGKSWSYTSRDTASKSTYLWTGTGSNSLDSTDLILSGKQPHKVQRVVVQNSKSHNFMLKEVSIKNMKNEIEMNTMCPIKLTDVTGPLVLSTINGNVDVIFDEVNKDKPISISTISGEIDITLPPKTRANLEMQTMSGTVYSNFDFPEQISSNILKYQLNGGGVNIKIVSVKGNIYLRKGK
jgi:hypothetical protein